MNFLAHCLIAAHAHSEEQRQAGLIAGGLLGDFVKGPVPTHWPSGVQLGVRLHRRIDAYSNHHEGIRRSSSRFEGPLRRFAPIFVDVIADHLLTLRWEQHHHESLTNFTRHCYRLTGGHRHLLGQQHREYLDWMQDSDLLAGYGDHDVMARGLRSITRRLGRSDLDEPMLEAVDRNLPALAEDFTIYFPDLIEHGAEYIAHSNRGS